VDVHGSNHRKPARKHIQMKTELDGKRMRVERSLVVLTVATLLVFAAPASATSALSAGGTAESIEPADHPLSESEDAYLADLHEDDLIPGDNETGNVTDDIDDVADEGSDTVDDAGNTLDDAAETVEDAEETVDGAEEAVGDVVDDTTDDADEVTDRATDTTEDVAGGTTSELDEILGETADIAVTETLRDSVTGTVVLLVEELDETVTKATSSVKEVTEGQNDDGETSENEDGSEQEDAPGEDSQTTTGETDPDYSTETSEGAVDEGRSADDRGGVLATVLSGLGNALPGSNAGAGVTIGTGTLGALFLTRKFGTAATLSSATGSGSSLLAAITTALREWAVRLLAILGYKRFSDDDPLEHETREQLYEYICTSPGSYMSEISEETDVPLQTARYHLRILEFENLVSDESVRGRRRYYPLGTDWTELAAALNDEATTAILETLAREGPDSVSSLAEKLDRDPSTISHHLQRLEADSIIAREREGRAVMNKLSPEARTALEPETTPRPDEAGEALAD